MLVLLLFAGDPGLNPAADLRSPILPPLPFDVTEPLADIEALVVVVVEGGVVEVNLLIEKLLVMCLEEEGLAGLAADTEANEDGTMGSGGSGPPTIGGR